LSSSQRKTLVALTAFYRINPFNYFTIFQCWKRKIVRQKLSDGITALVSIWCERNAKGNGIIRTHLVAHRQPSKVIKHITLFRYLRFLLNQLVAARRTAFPTCVQLFDAKCELSRFCITTFMYIYLTLTYTHLI
jgi:hypothetical protein